MLVRAGFQTRVILRADSFVQMTRVIERSFHTESAMERQEWVDAITTLKQEVRTHDLVLFLFLCVCVCVLCFVFVFVFCVFCLTVSLSLCRQSCSNVQPCNRSSPKLA